MLMSVLEEIWHLSASGDARSSGRCRMGKSRQHEPTEVFHRLLWDVLSWVLSEVLQGAASAA